MVEAAQAGERGDNLLRLIRAGRALMRRALGQAGEEGPLGGLLHPEGDADDIELFDSSSSLPNGEGSDLANIAQHGLQLRMGDEVLSDASLWVDVGSLSTQRSEGTLAPNAEADTPVRSGDYANVVYNDRLAHNIAYAATGIPILTSMLVEAAKGSCPDWLLLGVQAALYDTIRETGTTDLTGVAWAVAVNQDHVRFRINTNEVEEWNFRRVFVTMSFLENCIHRFSGAVPIGAGAVDPAGEFWFLVDSGVRVIVLDAITNDAELTWALWTLCHLRYPLTWLFDACAVLTDGPGDARISEWFLFQGTGSLVDAYNPATKIVFVLPANNLMSINFSDLSYEIATAARMGELPLAASDIDADPLIEWMINRVCSSRTPLKGMFEDYTRGKINGGLDWVEVDGLVGALTVRYPPRVE